MLKTYITRRRKEVAHIEKKKTQGKRNENGADEEDAAFEAKQTPQVWSQNVDLIKKTSTHTG